MRSDDKSKFIIRGFRHNIIIIVPKRLLSMVNVVHKYKCICLMKFKCLSI